MKGVAMSSERLLPRRSIIKGGAVLGAALAAAAAGFGPVRALADEGEIEVIATHDEAGEIEVIATREDSAAIEDTQYGFIVNTARCVNCGECVQACHTYNGLPEGTTGRRRITPYESSFGKRVYVSTSCMHCENPSCRDVCPAGAMPTASWWCIRSAASGASTATRPAPSACRNIRPRAWTSATAAWAAVCRPAKSPIASRPACSTRSNTASWKTSSGKVMARHNGARPRPIRRFCSPRAGGRR